MQTTSSAMIDDLLTVIGKHKSNFVGFYDDLKALQDAIPNPADGLQAIVIGPSEFYYHVIGNAWTKFAPVGEVHPSYVGAYDTIQDLQSAISTPNDGDMAIVGKQKFYIYAGTQWEALIVSTSGTDTAQVTKNTADITTLKSTTATNAQNYKDNKRRINKINTILTLTRATLANLDPRPVYEYQGAGVPTLPNKPHSAYFIDVFAMQQDGRIDLPYFADTPIRGGTVFFLSNSDSDNSIRVYPQGGESISSASSINVPPGSVLAIAKTPTGWQRLFGGYMASSFVGLLNAIKKEIKNDLHTTAEIEAITNSWLANPTTKANLDKIILSLGYEKANGGTGPDPSTVRVHFGTGDNYPTNFDNEVGEVAPHEDMIITGLNNNPRKVWVAVPQEIATKVSGIKANDGLPARWPFTKATINGGTWTIFQSPTRLADSRIDLDIVWRI